MAVLNKPMAWSFSVLDAYETCPLQLKETRITKRFSDRNKFNAAGTNDHSSMEGRFMHGTPLPAPLSHLEPMVSRLIKIPGTARAEAELCLNAQWQPTGWFSKNAWARAKIDLDILNVDRGISTQFDWKFGKRRKESRWLQLKINTLITSATLQAQGVEVGLYNNALVWCGEGSPDIEPLCIPANKLNAVRCEVMERVEVYAQAYEKDVFPAKKNGLCRKYCPVLSCKHNG